MSKLYQGMFLNVKNGNLTCYGVGIIKYKDRLRLISLYSEIDTCIKEIVDFREKDYKTFQNFNKFGGKMNNLIKEFKKEYAFSVFPSKLSNQHFFSKT
jgi:hypothetical protein